MTIVLSTPPYQYFTDDNGNPLSGGKVYTYLAGTLTPRTTYTDQTGSTPAANPVILDSAGRAEFWLDDSASYKFIVTTSADVTIRTIDNVAPFSTATGLDVLGTIASNTLIGNNTGAAANPSALTVAQVQTMLGIGGAAFNMLHNGSFNVWQRATTFDSTTTPANSDDNYLADGCILLSDGNDIVDVSRESTIIPTGALYSLKSDVETANKKFGYLFPIEQLVAQQAIGGVASLSFKARKGTNATLETIRAAILAWDGTADAITSDVVSAWAVAGTNPTLVANWTYENTPTSLTLTTSFQTFTIENISIDTASAKNLAVFIWVDDTDATVADTWYLGDVNLTASSSAQAIIRRPYQQELALCKRYLPVVNLKRSSNAGIILGQCFSTTQASIGFQFDVTPRTAPTGVTVTGATNMSLTTSTLTLQTISTIVFGNAADNYAAVTATVASGLTAGNATMLATNNSGSNQQIVFTGAEL